MSEIETNRTDADVANVPYFNFLEEPEQKGRLSRAVTALGLGVVAVGAAYASLRTGVDISGLLDKQVVPSPSARPEIVDGFVAVNETLRSLAPPMLAGGLAVRAAQKLGSSPKSQAFEELASQDFSGVDVVSKGKSHAPSSFLGRIRQRVNNAKVGLGVATASVLLTGVSSGLEHEISNGPLRPVDSLFDAFEEGESNQHIITQARETTFMDSSYLDDGAMRSFASEAKKNNIDVIPFDLSLANIDARSAIVIGIPNEAFEQEAEVTIEGSCDDMPVILDNANPKQIGEEVSINGVDANIVEKDSGAAQMNRDVAVVPVSSYRECVTGDEDSPYFGAIVNPNKEDPERIEELMTEHDLQSASLLTKEEFRDNNRDFWRKNGTPIVLQLIGYIGALSGIAIASKRRGDLQQNIREIGTLNALGVTMKDIRKIETRRAFRDTGRSAVLAAPLMPLMAGMFNMAEVGLRVGVGLREIAVGYTVTLAAKLAGSTRAVKKISKDMSLPDAVRG